MTGDDGSTEEWLIEMGAHNTMRRAGFKTELFAIGDVVTVSGWPARRETNAMTLRSAVLADGTELSPRISSRTCHKLYREGNNRDGFRFGEGLF